MKLGGKFTLSDDSHCVAHIGTKYELALDFLETLGLKEVYVLKREENASVINRESGLVMVPVQISQIKLTSTAIRKI